MWEVLVRTPRGSNNPRKFSMLLATFFVATFGYLLLSAPTAHAVDAAWSGDDVSYNGDTYTKVTDTSALPSDVKAGTSTTAAMM